MTGYSRAQALERMRSGVVLRAQRRAMGYGVAMGLVIGLGIAAMATHHYRSEVARQAIIVSNLGHALDDLQEECEPRPARPGLLAWEGRP